MGIASIRKTLLAAPLPSSARADTLRMNYQPSGRQAFAMETATGTVTVVAEPRSSEAVIVDLIRAELAKGSNNNDGTTDPL